MKISKLFVFIIAALISLSTADYSWRCGQENIVCTDSLDDLSGFPTASSCLLAQTTETRSVVCADVVDGTLLVASDESVCAGNMPATTREVPKCNWLRSDSACTWTQTPDCFCGDTLTTYSCETGVDEDCADPKPAPFSSPCTLNTSACNWQYGCAPLSATSATFFDVADKEDCSAEAHFDLSSIVAGCDKDQLFRKAFCYEATLQIVDDGNAGCIEQHVVMPTKVYNYETDATCDFRVRYSTEVYPVGTSTADKVLPSSPYSANCRNNCYRNPMFAYPLCANVDAAFEVIADSTRCSGYNSTLIDKASPCGSCTPRWVCAAPGTDSWQDCEKGDKVGFVRPACSETAGATVERQRKCIVSYTLNGVVTDKEVMPWFCDASKEPETSISNECKYDYKCAMPGSFETCQDYCEWCADAPQWNGAPTCVDSDDVAVIDAAEAYYCKPAPVFEKTCHNTCTVGWMCRPTADPQAALEVCTAEGTEGFGLPVTDDGASCLDPKPTRVVECKQYYYEYGVLKIKGDASDCDASIEPSSELLSRELCVYEWQCKVTDANTMAVTYKDCAHDTGVCKNGADTGCFLGVFEKTVRCIDQNNREYSGKCADDDKPSSVGDKCIEFDGCSFMWMCAQRNKLKPAVSELCAAEDVDEGFPELICNHGGPLTVWRTVTCAADVDGVPYVAPGQQCSLADKPLTSIVKPECHAWTENISACAHDGVSCMSGTQDITYTCDAGYTCDPATKPDDKLAQSCRLQPEEFKCHFDFYCFPEGTSDADLALYQSDNGCADDNHFFPAGPKCHATDTYRRRVACYDPVMNKLAWSEDKCSNRPEDEKVTGTDAECHFKVYYSFQAVCQQHTGVDTADEPTYCNDNYNLFIPEYKYPYCYNDDLGLMAPPEKCDDFPAAEEIPRPATVCNGAHIQADWYCAPTMQDLSDSNVELCSSKFGRGGYSEQACSMDSTAMMQRVVRCAVFNATDNAAVVVDASYCETPMPVSSQSNACIHAQLCWNDATGTYAECHQDCIPCTTEATPISPVCVKAVDNVSVPVDADVGEDYYCEPVPATRVCENKCRFHWFVRNQAADAPFAGYELCAADDLTTAFGLPADYPATCVDEQPTRHARCLQYYESESELDAWEQPVLVLHSQAEDDTVCGDKPVEALPQPHLCTYDWMCRVIGESEVPSFEDCSTVEANCLANDESLSASDCYNGKLQRDVVCVNQSGGTNESKCSDIAPPPDACVVDTGCEFTWLCNAPDSTEAVACDGDNGSNGFSTVKCVEEPEPATDIRGVACYKTLEGVLVKEDDERCDANTKAVDSRVVPVCLPWTAVYGTCTWDSATCLGGTQEVTYVCDAGEGMCVANKPATIEDHPCTLETSQCHFEFVCAPADTADDDLAAVDNKSCAADNHFVPADERRCYKNRAFERRVVCYDVALNILSTDESTDCIGEKPVSSQPFTDESECMYKAYCAATGTADFTDAPTRPETFTLCTVDDQDTAMSPCTVKCDHAERTRAVQCVSELGTPADDDDCDGMPVSSVSCTTDAIVTNLSIERVDGNPDFVVGSEVRISWCYYAGAVYPTPLALLTLSSGSSAFFATRLAQPTLSAGSVVVNLPIVVSASDAVVTLASSVTTLDTPVFSILSKCQAYENYCGEHGSCDERTSQCTCPSYTGDRCEISPCEAAQCYPGRGVCEETSNQCTCHAGFTGTHCEQPIACSSVTTCLNDGFVNGEGAECDAACTCKNSWQGADCGTCGLSCSAPTNGHANADCSACVCNAGYAGADCSCRRSYGTLIFLHGQQSMLQNAAWQATLLADLAIVLGVPVSSLEIVVPHPDTGKVGVVLTSCDTEDNLAAMNDLWADVVQDMSNNAGILRTGAALLAISQPIVKIYTASAVYDPACSGVACMVGVNPYDPSPYVPPCGEPDNECVYSWKCRSWKEDGTYTFVDCAEIPRDCASNENALSEPQCYNGTLQRDMRCVNQSDGILDTACDLADAPSDACIVDTGCEFTWLCNAPDSTEAVACDGDNGSNGFSTVKCVEEPEPATDIRGVACYKTLEGVLVKEDDERCDADTKAPEERTVPVCLQWTEVPGACTWDSATCLGGTQEVTFACVEEGMCVANKPATIEARACTLETSQCHFEFVCAPADTADEDLAAVDNKSCAADNHFVPADERKCYKNRDFERRVVCYDVALNIVSSDESTDCIGEKPVSSQSFTDESDCTYQAYCAATGTADFTDAPTHTDTFTACAVGDEQAGLSDCTVTCDHAERTRAVKCVSEVGTPVDDEKCGTMPASSVPCTTAALVSNLTVEPLDGGIVVGKRIRVSWCYYPGALTTSPSALLSLSTPSNSFFTTRVALLPLSVGFAIVVVPTLPSTQDVVMLLESTVNNATTAPFELMSKCLADPNYCSGHGSCTDASSTCICSGLYTGDRCQKAPCDVCNLAHSVCSNSGTNAGVCYCHPGFKGTSCDFANACTHTSCLNGGYIDRVDNKCDTDCTCKNSWQGSTCGTCGLTCTSPTNGVPNSSCSGCTCNLGYIGDRCQCRVLYTTVQFSGLPSDALLDSAWVQTLWHDFVIVTGLSPSDVEFSAPVGGMIMVTIKVCDAVQPSSFVNRLLSVRTLGSVENTYDKWALAQADVASEQSIILSGAAMQHVAALGASIKVSAVYDPLCTGLGCPSGENPYGTSPTDHTNHTTTIILAVVLGSAALVTVAAVWWCLRRRKAAHAVVVNQNQVIEEEGKKDTHSPQVVNVDLVYNDRS